MTRHQQVLNLLAIAFIDKSPFPISVDNKIYISGGWRPVWYFVGKGKGGSAGYQRLWELKDRFGVPWIMRIHYWEYWDGEKTRKTNTPIYKLDIINLSLTNIKQGIEAEKFSKWKFGIGDSEQIDMEFKDYG